MIDKWGENVFDPHMYDEPEYEETCDECGETFPCKCDRDCEKFHAQDES